MAGSSEKWKVTALKRNGAVWTETFDSKDKALEYVGEIATDFPHIVLSNKMTTWSNN